MKTLTLSLLLVASLGVAVAAQDDKKTTQVKEHDAQTAAGETVKRGAPIGDSPQVAFADVLKEPSKYAGKTLTVEGVVERVCTKKGCWMEIAPKAGAEGVRVTFKDYGFFVPTNSNGMKFKAEGQFDVKLLSKEKADHYAEEGARIKRNDDGTANEVTFVASGVELWK